MAYGRTVLTNNNVFRTRVSADGSPKYKVGGATVDWSTVSALGSDTTYPDGSIVRTGAKVLRYGQVVCAITGSANTLNTSGTPTGGTFTLTVTTNLGTATTGAIAYNAAASAVVTALTALSNVGTGNVTATGGPLTTGAVTLTFASILGTATLALANNSLTGGTTPSVAIGASIATGATSGYYGPYDPTASDGRQTLSRGYCFIVDETLLQYSSGDSRMSPSNDQVGGLIEGGDIWIDRVIQSGGAAHTLALGPTLAEFLAAFPTVTISAHN
jgi:hypothetical protein